jgi:glycosyltransferase involved in cell wall biosynthesis
MPRALYVQYVNPAFFPPLQQSSRVLADAGWQVRFVGCRASAEDKMEFPPHERIEVRLLAHTPPGWRQKLQYLQFALLCWWNFLVWRPAWIYVSDAMTCPVAWTLSLWPGARIIYHEHDTPAENANLLNRVCLAARRKLAGRARLCLAPNRLRLEKLLADTGATTRSLTVWNCPSGAEAATPKPASTDGEMRVLYHGSIVPSRVPETLVRALALLPEQVKLRLIGYETIGSQGYVRHLQELADALGVGERFAWWGPLSRHELMRRCGESDVGVSLFPMPCVDWNERTMPGASCKAFDYLACGLPLLVSDLPEWNEMFVEEGYARAADVNDPASIAAALSWYYENRAETRAMGERGRQRVASGWNYERQFAPVLAFLNGSI